MIRGKREEREVDNNLILLVLGRMEWQKAKGHLEALLETFPSEDLEKYSNAESTINGFIDSFERMIYDR